MGLDVVQVEQGAVVQVTEQIASVQPAPEQIALVDVTEHCAEVTAEEQVVVVSERAAPGAPGSSGLITGTAGETLHGHRAVRVADGLLYHPDTAIAAHAPAVIGIALQSADVGESAVVRTAGTVTEPSWTWMAGFVFCGADGQLTQSPGSGWLLPVGRAINPTTLDVDIDDPTIRS